MRFQRYQIAYMYQMGGNVCVLPMSLIKASFFAAIIVINIIFIAVVISNRCY